MDCFITFVLLVLAAVFASISADIVVPDLKYVTAYEGDDLTGPFHEFLDSSPDLSDQGMDNAIGSVCGTGQWLFYDNISYEFYDIGLRGFNVCLNVSEFEISSLRYAGSPYGVNDIYYNLYEGTTFQGAEFSGNTNAGYFGALDLDVSSIIISGQSPWTFFTGLDYTGEAVCVYPDLSYTDPSGMELNSFWLPYMTFLSLQDNSIRSVLRGCLSPNVVRAQSFKDVVLKEETERRILKKEPHTTA